MARASKGVLGKTLTSLPLLALASAAWVVLLAGLAIAESKGNSPSYEQSSVHAIAPVLASVRVLHTTFEVITVLQTLMYLAGASGLGFPWFIWAFEGFVLFFCILHLIGELFLPPNVSMQYLQTHLCRTSATCHVAACCSELLLVFSY